MSQSTVQFDDRFIDIVLAEAVESGGVVIQLNIIGIAVSSGEVGDKITIDTQGIKRLPAINTLNFFVGENVYWDESEKHLTTVESSNVLIGNIVASKAFADTEADVRLHAFLAPLGGVIEPGEIKGTVAGSVLVIGADLDATTIAPGTAGQIMTSNGPGVPGSFEDGGGGGGSVTPSSSTTFTNKSIDADTNPITNIGASEVGVDLISGQSILGTIRIDQLLYQSISAGTLKRNTIGNILSDSVAQAPNSAIASSDLMTFRAASATTTDKIRKATIAQIVAAGGGGGGSVTASSSDTFTNKSIDANNNPITNIGAGEVGFDLIDGQNLVPLSTADGDFLLIADVSAGTLVKQTLINFVNEFSASPQTFSNKSINAANNSITNIGADEVNVGLITNQGTSPVAVQDQFLFHDVSTGFLATNDIGSILSNVINSSSTAGVVGTDLMMFRDNSLGVPNKTRKATINDIVAAGGGGITPSSTTTFTNKAIDANTNPISNIGFGEVIADIITGQILGGTSLVDPILFYSGDKSAIRKNTIGSILSDSAIQTPTSTALSSDFMTFRSNSAAAPDQMRRATITDIVSAGVGPVTITGQPLGGSARADPIMFYDVSMNILRRNTLGSIESDLLIQASAATPIGTDFMTFRSNATADPDRIRRATISEIVNAGGAITGTSSTVFSNKGIDADNNTITNIGASEIETGIITDQPLGGHLLIDPIMFYSNTAGTMRKNTIGSILSDSVAQAPNSGIASTDLMTFRSASAAAPDRMRKATIAQIVAAGGGGVTASSSTTFTNKAIDADNNSITNIGAPEVEAGLIGSQVTAAPEGADQLLFNDLSEGGGTLRKAVISDIVLAGGAITDTSSDTLSNKGIDADNNTITNIGASEVQTGIIFSQPVVTPVGADSLLLYDTSAAMLRRNTISNIVAAGGAITASSTDTLTGKSINADNNPITNIGASEIESGIITGQTALTTLDVDDELLVHDDSASALRRATIEEIGIVGSPAGNTITIATLTSASLFTQLPILGHITATDGYEDYIIEGTITPATAGGDAGGYMYIETSADNGSNWVAPLQFVLGISGTESDVSGTASADARFMTNKKLGQSFQVSFIMRAAKNTALKHVITGECSWLSNANQPQRGVFSAFAASAQQINAVRIRTSAGNFGFHLHIQGIRR